MISKQLFLVFFLFTAAFSPALAAKEANIILIIADDLGVDASNQFNFSKNKASTPNIDALAKKGIVFDNFWATPACTTTRGAIMTGQHGFQSGIDYVPAVASKSLRTLQEHLKKHKNYKTAIFGKWHLGGSQPELNHPSHFGIDHYEGNLFNLDNYYAWTVTKNGKQFSSKEYHTSYITTQAIDWFKQNNNRPKFLWLAYSAPHTPFHKAPESLLKKYRSLDESKIDSHTSEAYFAAIEAMDTEIGRLLSAISPKELENTMVFFMGDNGTPKKAMDKSVFPKEHGKGSVYEGGIRTPLIASGPLLKNPNTRNSSLVNVVDFFATISELANISSRDLPEHSYSFAPSLRSEKFTKRKYNYSEFIVKGNESWTVRNLDFKYINFNKGEKEQLFKVSSDISESNDLSQSSQHHKILKELRSYGEKIRKQRFSPGEAPFSKQNAGLKCSDYQGKVFSQTAEDKSKKTLLNSFMKITQKNERCYFQTNNIPDHNFNDLRPFPFAVSEINKELSLLAAPKLSPQSTPLSLQYDDGILLNGVKIDLLAAACYGVGDEKIGCHDLSHPWRFDPLSKKNSFRLDSFHAHTQPNGEYHYHGPHEKFFSKNKTDYGVLGFAADGFPIRKAAVKIKGKAQLLRSSYRLKKGKRQNTFSSKYKFPGGNYDGQFRGDYEFIEGLGDLDECNGQTVDGVYSYFVTQSYPYFMNCFKGVVDESFKKTGNKKSSAKEKKGRKKGRKRRNKKGPRGSRRGQRRANTNDRK